MALFPTNNNIRQVVKILRKFEDFLQDFHRNIQEMTKFLENRRDSEKKCQQNSENGRYFQKW